MSKKRLKLKQGIFKMEGIDVAISADTIDKIEDVSGFLDKRVHDSEGILIGPKGAGKSLLLNARAWINANKNGTKSIPKKKRGDVYAFELTMSLNTSSLQKHVGYNDYFVIWKFSLSYFIVKLLRDDYGVTIPNYEDDKKQLPGSELLGKISDDNNDFSDLGSIVSTILRNRLVYQDLEEAENQLVNILRNIDSVIDEDYTMYIDNVDQAFLEKISFKGNKNEVLPHFEAILYDKKEKAKVDIWLHANIAFLKAVWNLNKKKYFITIFASIRYEAWKHLMYNPDLDFNFPNMEGNTVLIKYNKEQLRALVDNYVEIQDSPVKERMRTLMDMERIHPKATNEDLNKETFKDLIIRHTFGNPRDLVFLLPEIGDKLIDKIVSDKDIDIAEFGLFVDEEANKKVFKKYFIRDCLPFFPKRELDNFINEIKKNYFTISEMNGNMELVKMLYRFGLIGTVHKSESGEYIQKFRRGSNYAEKSMEMEDSEIYLLHPCLDFQLREKNKNFYYQHCIIGNELAFNFKRSLDYYLPPLNTIPKQGALKMTITNIYKSFYESKDSVEIFSKIPHRLNSSYASIIINFLIKENKEELIETIKKSLCEDNNGIGSSKNLKIILASQTKKSFHNVGKLGENIQLRILIAITVIFDLLIGGQDVLEIFDDLKYSGSTGIIYSALFCQGIYRPRSKKMDKMEVFNSLSHFEKKVVKEFVMCQNVIDSIEGAPEKELEKLKKKKNKVIVLLGIHE